MGVFDADQETVVQFCWHAWVANQACGVSSVPCTTNVIVQEADRERERQAMRAAKQEWQLRQMEAFRNRKQVESDRADPPSAPSPLVAAPVYAPSAPRRPVLPSEWQHGYAEQQVTVLALCMARVCALGRNQHVPTASAGDNHVNAETHCRRTTS